MDPVKIQRINELKKLSRQRELVKEELAEQAALRAEYIADFRASLQQQLDSVRIQEEDGSLTPLQKKEDNPSVAH